MLRKIVVQEEYAAVGKRQVGVHYTSVRRILHVAGARTERTFVKFDGLRSTRDGEVRCERDYSWSGILIGLGDHERSLTRPVRRRLERFRHVVGFGTQPDRTAFRHGLEHSKLRGEKGAR